jgi:hypothetical protein
MFSKMPNASNLLYTLLVAVLFIGCGHEIHSGKIISKSYEQSRTYTYFTPVMCGKTTVLIPHTGYDDEDFILTVMAIKGNDTITEDFYVNESTYHCMEKGYFFNDTIPCEREDDGLR